MQGRRVVITGLGPVTPIGIGADRCWNAILNGRSGVRRLTEFDSLNLKSKIAGTIDDFSAEKFALTLSEVRRMDRHVQFARAAADMAIADARLDVQQEDRERIGVNVATAVAGTKFMDEEFLVLTNRGARPVDPDDASPYSYTKSMPNTAANEIAARWGLQGICTTTVTGCTGGIDAIGVSFDHIAAGSVDVVITGGTEAPITPVTIAAFDVIGAISTRNDDPPRASRPFDKDRDAFVLAEGAGLFVLEELQHALRRNAPIHAEVLGFASVSNAFHMTGLGGPAKEHLARAMKLALEDAGVRPDEVDYVNAHGSSTQQNDVCETEALKLAFGECIREIPVSSTKSMTGHALAAASAMEIAFCALAMKHQFIPPTINLECASPECDLDYVPHRGRPAAIDLVLKSASGFSGIHSAIVLKRWVA